MFAQPFLNESVDVSFTPSFGGALYKPSHCGPSTDPRAEAYTRTTSPIVTGTSVIGIIHKTGVVLAADTLASYGSLARFMHLERLKKIGANVIIGGSGEYSDFQEIVEMLENLVRNDFLADDGNDSTPKEVHRYLTRVMYNMRSKMNPLWNSIVISGFDGETPFLGVVDLHGTSFEDTTVATGFGAHLARPLLRNAYRPDLSEEEAVKAIEESMRVLYYRDARAINRIQVARVTKAGITISEPYSLDTYWLHGEAIPRNGSF